MENGSALSFPYECNTIMIIIGAISLSFFLIIINALSRVRNENWVKLGGQHATLSLVVFSTTLNYYGEIF